MSMYVSCLYAALAKAEANMDGTEKSTRSDNDFVANWYFHMNYYGLQNVVALTTVYVHLDFQYK